MRFLFGSSLQGDVFFLLPSEALILQMPVHISDY